MPWGCHVKQCTEWLCSWNFKKCVHSESCESFPRTTRQWEWVMSCHFCNNSRPRLYSRLTPVMRHGIYGSKCARIEWKHPDSPRTIQGCAVFWQSDNFRILGSISLKEERQLMQLWKVQHWNIYELPPDVVALNCWEKMCCSSMITLTRTRPLRFGNFCNLFSWRIWTIRRTVPIWCHMIFISSQLSREILVVTDLRVMRMSKQRWHTWLYVQVTTFYEIGKKKSCPSLRHMPWPLWQLGDKIKCPSQDTMYSVLCPSKFCSWNNNICMFIFRTTLINVTISQVRVNYKNNTYTNPFLYTRVYRFSFMKVF